MQFSLIFGLFTLVGTLSTSDGQKIAMVKSEQFAKTYVVTTRGNMRNFLKAKDFCQENGGILAKIESSDEWKWVLENIEGELPGSANGWFWIGATPVGSGQTPTHWLDGTKIADYIWRSSSAKSRNSDCNGLTIGTSGGEPMMEVRECATTNTFIVCQQDPPIKDPVKDQVRDVNSNKVRLYEQQLTEKKSTIAKLQDELKRSRAEVSTLKTENAICSKSNENVPSMMSTINQLSSTVNQLMNKVTQLERNEKLLKQRLAEQ